MDMNSRQPDPNIAGMQDDVDDMEGDEEVEVTREELIEAMQAVVTDLSEGLKGSDREAYLDADDLAQNDWFFAGASDRPGQYAVTMWPAEGDEDMLRIDIGSEDDVHNLAASPDQIAALTDDFIEGLSEEYDEDYDDELDEEEEFDEEEELDEEYDEELDEEYEEEYEEVLEEEELEEEDDVSRNGRR